MKKKQIPGIPMERQSPFLRLPEQITFSILLKLRVKSLIKLKCVCKNWNSIIQSQIFKLNYAISSPERCLFLYRYENSSNLRLCTTLWESPFSVLSDIQVSSCCNDLSCNLVNWIDQENVIGSCNGLLCIFGYDLFLWNPILRKHKILPKISSSFLESRDDDPLITFGFGFDSNTGDYKVVRITFVGPKRKLEAKVYSLRLDSWRRLKIPENITGRFYVSEVYECAYVNGALHWMMEFAEANYLSILRFDISEERFDVIEKIMLHGLTAIPLVFNGSFALFIRNFDSSKKPEYRCHIRTMKYGLWSKLKVKLAYQDLFWPITCVNDHLVVIKNEDDMIFLAQPQTGQEIALDIDKHQLASICDFRESFALL